MIAPLVAHYSVCLMRLLKYALLFLVLSGCYQSRTVDRDFEEMVDYMTIKYGVDMRKPGSEHIRIHAVSARNPVSMEKDPRKKAVQVIEDGGMLQRRAGLFIFPKYIKVQSYVPGEYLSFKTDFRFIGKTIEKVKVSSDGEHTKVFSDKYGRFLICFSMMREEEREWLDKVEEELADSKIKSIHTKYIPRDSVGMFDPFQKQINMNQAFCEMIKEHDQPMYQRFLDRFSDNPNKALGQQGVVAAIQRDDNGAQVFVTLSVGSEEGVSIGDEFIIYRDKAYIVNATVRAAEADTCHCAVDVDTWNTLGLRIQMADFVQSNVFQEKGK